MICPNIECKAKFEHSDLYGILKKEQMDNLNETLFKVYQRKAVDVKSCTNKSCTYAGYIDASHNKCKDDFVCTVCATSWREKEINGSRTWKERGELFMKVGLREMLNDVYKEILTNTCPKCGISISKNGGCPHMTCKACNFEFCWFCSQVYSSHHDIRCFSSVMAKISFLLIFMLHLFINSGFHTVLKPYFLGFLIFLAKFVFYNGTICLFFMLYSEGNYQYNAVKYSRNLTYKLKRLQGYIISETLLTAVYLGLLWYFELFCNCMFYYIVEGILALTVLVFHDFVNNWARVTF
jgi:hypothetical protein